MAGTVVLAGGDIRQEPVHFAQGSSTAVRSGKIRGYQSVDYQVSARAGQTLVVTFTPSNRSAYFNVLPPGSMEAIFIGSTLGNHFKGELPVDGVYTIQVYLMRNAARRNESAGYTLELKLDDKEKTAATTSQAPLVTGGSGGFFDKTLELQGITFHITSGSQGSDTLLRIAPSGLEVDNSPIEKRITGTVTGAEVADLNVDGSPEVYVYVRAPGDEDQVSLVAYSVNRRKSLSEIFLPPLTDNAAASKGHRGHDEFAVLEGVLGHRFPLYQDSTNKSQPTGSMRQLQYKLVPGEAGWQFKIDQILEF
jgi:hypothetical protein